VIDQLIITGTTNSEAWNMRMLLIILTIWLFNS